VNTLSPLVELPPPAGITPKEHGGGYPSKNQLDPNDLECAILRGRRGACSGNRYNGQFPAIPADADRISLWKKGGVFSDRSGFTTAVSIRALTSIDTPGTAESLDLTTLKHGGPCSEKKNTTFYPIARALDRANDEFSRREESETLLEPVVKKSVTKAYIPCETLGVFEGTNDDTPFRQ